MLVLLSTVIRGSQLPFGTLTEKEEAGHPGNLITEKGVRCKPNSEDAVMGCCKSLRDVQ